MTQYHDATQAIIEAGLLNALGCGLKADREQLSGATMLRHLIPYDEAKERVTQALGNIHGGVKVK